MAEGVLKQLVEMSNYLGSTERTYAILGEGNTSAKVDEDTFYVKASGTQLGTIDENGFVKVSISKVTAILDDESANDEAVTRVLKEACVEAGETRRPSVETMLHALLLQYPEYKFIGHTHPVFTSMILCSQMAEEVAMSRVCPDQVVVLGHKSVFVPYVDPGLVLAREVRARVRRFMEEEGVLPRAIMMQNHGLIAMGDSARAVMNITDMAEKMSRITVGTFSLGGPRYMSEKDVDRIYTRPDEKYREKLLGA